MLSTLQQQCVQAEIEIESHIQRCETIQLNSKRERQVRESLWRASRLLAEAHDVPCRQWGSVNVKLPFLTLFSCNKTDNATSVQLLSSSSTVHQLFIIFKSARPDCLIMRDDKSIFQAISTALGPLEIMPEIQFLQIASVCSLLVNCLSQWHRATRTYLCFSFWCLFVFVGHW